MIPVLRIPSDPLPTQPVGAPTATDIAKLQAQVERLLMITEALWGILKEQYGMDDKELQKRIALIDLRDGKLDGRVAPTLPASCPSCGRTVPKQSSRCVYCEEPLLVDPFAR